MSNPLAEDLDFILAHTKPLWDELRGQRIFITGGTGFFGIWLLESFAWANSKLGLNAHAVVLSRRPERFAAAFPHLFSEPAISFFSGDVRDFAFPEGSFSHIIHAATEASAKLNDENPWLMIDTIVRGTQRVLEFAEGAKAEKLLFTSSGAVYGRQPPEVTHITEDFPGAPDPKDESAAYGLGKRLAEFLCHNASRKTGLAVKIARCFAFVGPWLPLDIHFAIGNFIRDGLCGGPITLQGDGTPFRSYLYSADLVIWVWTILFKGCPGDTYNVGSDDAFPLAEIARIVARAFSPHPEFIVQKTPVPGATSQRYIPAISKAQQDLGLTAWHRLKVAVERTIRWHECGIGHCEDQV